MRDAKPVAKGVEYRVVDLTEPGSLADAIGQPTQKVEYDMAGVRRTRGRRHE